MTTSRASARPRNPCAAPHRRTLSYMHGAGPRPPDRAPRLRDVHPRHVPECLARHCPAVCPLRPPPLCHGREGRGLGPCACRGSRGRAMGGHRAYKEGRCPLSAEERHLATHHRPPWTALRRAPLSQPTATKRCTRA
jgi:hypothetical protein